MPLKLPYTGRRFNSTEDFIENRPILPYDDQTDSDPKEWKVNSSWIDAHYYEVFDQEGDGEIYRRLKEF
jgi:hypothetical protein